MRDQRKLLDYKPGTLNVDVHQVGPLTAVQIGGPTHVLPLLTLGDVPTNIDMVYKRLMDFLPIIFSIDFY